MTDRQSPMCYFMITKCVLYLHVASSSTSAKTKAHTVHTKTHRDRDMWHL